MTTLQLFLRNYFGFTRLEARGFWVITVLMMVLLVVNFSLSYFNFSKVTLTPKDEQKLEAVLANLHTPAQAFGAVEANNPVGERFTFNPNGATEQDLLRLGIPQNFVKSILKYRSKGGKFKKRTDLQKIYNFPADLYESLEAYIDLPTQTTPKQYNSYKEESKARRSSNLPKNTIQPFDLNTADTATLSQIRGIGAKTAQQIVDYRQKLGGFVSHDQLQEVFLLKDKPAIVAELSTYALIQTPATKINLNTVSLEILQAHPYFRNVAKAIVSYRTKAGKFTTIEGIQKMKAINPEVWKKIKDYIVLEEISTK